MKKKWIAALLAVSCAGAVALTACNGNTQNESSTEESSLESSLESSVESSAEENSESSAEAKELTAEQAEQLVKDSLPLDFEGITISLNDDNRSWNGRTYYHFLLDTDQVTLETSVLVDKENSQVFTYYPDGSAYAPVDDPFCKSYGQEVNWAGTYVSEEGVTLSLEPIDSGSFEFTFTGSDGSLEQQLAQTNGTQADSTSIQGATVHFVQENGVITVTVDGPLPGTLSVAGTYSLAE